MKKNNQKKFQMKKENELVIKIYESRSNKVLKKRKSRPAWKHIIEDINNYF